MATAPIATSDELRSENGRWFTQEVQTCGQGESEPGRCFAADAGVGFVSGGRFMGTTYGVLSMARGTNADGTPSIGLSINVYGHALAVTLSQSDAEQMLVELTALVRKGRS
jgi:hypothetical protein